MAKNETVRFDEKTRRNVQSELDLRDRFKNSYFWRSNSVASGRRKSEQNNSSYIEFDHDGHHFFIENDHQESCRNIYHKFNVYIDGEKKTASALKKYM